MLYQTNHGGKPVQAESSTAFKPIFSHISNVYLIHDAFIIANYGHFTLNPNKRTFGWKEIKFGKMLFSSEGAKPDPKNKEELRSFTCMMPSGSDFINYLLKSVAPLRTLLNSLKCFNWATFHQNVFQKLLQEFRKETLLIL